MTKAQWDSSYPYPTKTQWGAWAPDAIAGKAGGKGGKGKGANMIAGADPISQLRTMGYMFSLGPPVKKPEEVADRAFP